MLEKTDDLSWYARKADGLRRGIAVPAAGEDGARADRVAALLDELRRGGIRGSVEERTLYTRRLPAGCRGCLAGKGTNLYVTGLCTRDCYFCFNAKPRADEIVAHGIRIREPEEAGEIVSRFGLRSVGISGGEPLLFPERVMRVVRTLRTLPERIWIDLYTNGDRADDDVLRGLREAGLDAVRFNLVANGFDTGPVERALRYFDGTAVEVPVVPDRMRELEEMALELDRLGVPYLNIHELFACRENDLRVSGRGHSAEEAGRESALSWSPVTEGEEAALRLLLFALKNTDRLSVYYCSCRTQETISRRGLRRRRGLAAGAREVLS
ncbi:MAG: radical SAM protein [Elusimicrobiota bacterium]